MKTKYHFTNDPGHGWLHVKRKELVRLGVAHKISTYSYERGETVYLEEDSDAGIFLKAKEQAGEEVSIVNSYRDRRSSIRGYASYRP